MLLDLQQGIAAFVGSSSDSLQSLLSRLNVERDTLPSLCLQVLVLLVGVLDCLLHIAQAGSCGIGFAAHQRKGGGAGGDDGGQRVGAHQCSKRSDGTAQRGCGGSGCNRLCPHRHIHAGGCSRGGGQLCTVSGQRGSRAAVTGGERTGCCCPLNAQHTHGAAKSNRCRLSGSEQRDKASDFRVGLRKLQHRLGHASKSLCRSSNHRQQLCANLLDEVTDGDLCLLQFFCGGVHLCGKFVLHRTCRPGLVADKAELAVVLGKRAHHQRDVVGVLLPEQFGQGNGALLIVEFFEASQKLAQGRLRVVANTLCKAVGRQPQIIQPFAKGFDALPTGLQTVE